MQVIRPITLEDLDILCQIASESGPGFTSLPENRELLCAKITASEQAFASSCEQLNDAQYLFVLEESTTGHVLGISGIVAAVGLNEPWYHYRIGTLVHASRELGVHNQFRTLYMCNDYTGASEVCTLFLRPDYRQKLSGKLLSKARFLFMAEFAECFADRVIAEMRGFSDNQGLSPFWEGLGKRFFSMEFARADYLTGSGNKAFIAELMPKHALYVHLLPDAAQAVIGQVHPNTAPARKMLEDEGFRFEGYVDIFDAGPTITARVNDIRAIRDSRYFKVRIKDHPPEGETYLISNTACSSFRCTLAQLQPQGSSVAISAELAAVLNLADGQTARLVELHGRQEP